MEYKISEKDTIYDSIEHLGINLTVHEQEFFLRKLSQTLLRELK